MRNYARELWIGGALAALTLIVFGRTCENQFVNFDDDYYVTGKNSQVQARLTLQSIGWAFTTLYAGNWHPLTWLSLQLDWQIYGPKPWGFHLTNALLHAANTVLLFWALRVLTDKVWESALVAALFAVHPLHVESVAWVAERKDVLSAFFWMATCLGYGWYTAKPGWARYLLTLAAFAAGLLAKPMLVTLPFVLLLFDYWPLARFRWNQYSKSTADSRQRPSQGTHVPSSAPLTTHQTPLTTLTFLLLEKMSFFLLAAASCLVTWHAQHQGPAVRSFKDYPLTVRLANALASYWAYLGQTIWPSGLCVFYPHPAGIFTHSPSSGITVWTIAAGFLLGLVSVIAVATRRSVPYVFVGWYWYVGTLVPVIGLVQLGGQARADRYTYVPLIGIFIAAVWAGSEVSRRWRLQPLVFGGSIILLLVLSFLSGEQIEHWRDSKGLWEHTLKVCPENTIAHTNLAVVYLNRFEHGGNTKDLEQSASHYGEAVRLDRGNLHARFQLGAVLTKQGKLEDAIQEYQKVLEFEKTLPPRPDFAMTHHNLGVLLKGQGKLKEAEEHFQRAAELGFPTPAR
jgi:hypothetical protein